MLVTTKNSVYSLVGKGETIHVTKVAALNPASSYYAPGHTIITKNISITIGLPMRFSDGSTIISTSPVVHIEG